MDVPPRCTDRAPATVALTGLVSNRTNGGGLWLVDFGGQTGIVNQNTGGYRVEALPGTHDVILRHLQAVAPQRRRLRDDRGRRRPRGRGDRRDARHRRIGRDRDAVVRGQHRHAGQRARNCVDDPLQRRRHTSTMDRLSQSYESDALAQGQR